MKLGMIGSYGHVGIILSDLGVLADELELAAVARYGSEDRLPFLGTDQMPPGVPVYDDYRDMLDKVAPDVVSVGMPFYRIAEASLAAVQAGAHVISEKPLAITWDDFHALKAAVDQAGVELIAMFQLRTKPAFQTIKRAIDDGRIGTPVYATAQKSYPFGQRDDYYKTRETYGGSILWQVIHALEFTHYTMAKPFKRVAAFASNQAHPTHPGLEDQGGMILEFEGGGTVVINFDYLRPYGKVKRSHGDDRLRIAGTDGVVETKDCAQAVELMTGDQTVMLDMAPQRRLFAEFIHALQGNGECILTTDESFYITEVALKARDAQDTGRIVDI